MYEPVQMVRICINYLVLQRPVLFSSLENGGTIFAKSGTFHSPNYPLPYSVSRDRVWIITNGQSHGSSLTLTLTIFLWVVTMEQEYARTII